MKVGGEWLAEVYGDLWLLPQALIASTSVGSPGRPAVSGNQHRGSCRWAHQNAVFLRLVMETNGVTEQSKTRRQTKKRKRKVGEINSWPLKGPRTSTWPSETQKRVMGTLALLVPIKYLSLWSAVIK